jgi:hypothetical protein
VLYFKPTGELLEMTPMPQFGATYQLDGQRLILTSTAGPLGPDPRPMILTLEGDVIHFDGKPMLRRIKGLAARGTGVRGTWQHLLEYGGMEQFWTFRSDGQVILEAGFAGKQSLTGNTLKLGRGSFVLTRSGDQLDVKGQGKEFRFIRRPWGCFGVPSEAKLHDCRLP